MPIAAGERVYTRYGFRRLLELRAVDAYRVDAHFDIVDEAPERTIRNGRAAISNRPGIGVELSRDKVRPFLWWRCGNARAESS